MNIIVYILTPLNTNYASQDWHTFYGSNKGVVKMAIPIANCFHVNFQSYKYKTPLKWTFYNPSSHVSSITT